MGHTPYDGCGNQATRDAAGAVTSYTWDGENRLTVAALPDGARHTMTYDAAGLRRRRETAAGTTLFVWDAQDVLVETDAQGATQATYTQTPALYGELISQRRGEASRFFHFDGLGSTVGLTDADETEADSYLYHAFGEELAQAGQTLNPFRFVGRVGYYDEAMLQLQYVRARWYAPGEGRWLARDAEEANPYAYVDNQPERFADPSGRTLWSRIIEWIKKGALAPARYLLYFGGAAYILWQTRAGTWCLQQVRGPIKENKIRQELAKRCIGEPAGKWVDVVVEGRKYGYHCGLGGPIYHWNPLPPPEGEWVRTELERPPIYWHDR